MLTENQWVTRFLVTPIKDKMRLGLGLEQQMVLPDCLSLTFVSSSYYKPLNRSTSLSEVRPRPLQIVTSNFDQFEYIQDQILHFFKKGRLVSAEALAPNAISWIEDFISFATKNEIYAPLMSFLEYAIMLDNVNFRGASHPHFLGSLFLHFNPNDSQFDFFVSIIHESAHQELFLINFVDRLVVEKYDFQLIHAPYQNKLRPPIGRLHSAHALFRMIQFVQIFDATNEKLNFFVSKFNDNLSSLDEKELTDFGRHLLKGVYEPFAKTL